MKDKHESYETPYAKPLFIAKTYLTSTTHPLTTLFTFQDYLYLYHSSIIYIFSHFKIIINLHHSSYNHAFHISILPLIYHILIVHTFHISRLPLIYHINYSHFKIIFYFAIYNYYYRKLINPQQKMIFP